MSTCGNCQMLHTVQQDSLSFSLSLSLSLSLSPLATRNTTTVASTAFSLASGKNGTEEASALRRFLKRPSGSCSPTPTLRPAAVEYISLSLRVAPLRASLRAWLIRGGVRLQHLP